MNIKSTIIGTTMLVVLLTAGAAQSLAGSNTVTSDDIVDFSIVANDIKTAAIGGRPIVDNSITGADVNEATLSPRTFFAQVKADGQIGSASPGVTSAKSDTGRYVVDFPRDMTGCAATANTAAIVGADTSTTSVIYVEVGRSVFTGASTDDVGVATVAAGTGTFTNGSFVLTAVCP